MSDSESSKTASGFADELLQLNTHTNLSYTEISCVIVDLETYNDVYSEQINHLKNAVSKQEIEYKYKVELRDNLRQMYEELKKRDKSLDELIKVKNNNVELTQEIYDLKKQKAVEKERQDKISLEELHDAYKESMKIFQSNPLVIKRNELRKQVAKRKFDILYLKQKISDAEKVFADLEKMKKQLEQKEIIKFAKYMIKYYKKQREQNETNNLQKISEKHQENVVAKPLKKQELNSFMNPTNYDHIYKKTLSPFKTTLRNIEIPKLNIKQIQLPTFNMSNYHFNPKNYFNTNLSVISKPSGQQAYIEPPKQTNIFNTTKLNYKPSTLPKFEQKIKKSIPTQSKRENISTKQTKQKQELKRPADTQESIIKSKLTKNKQETKLAFNTSTEKKERLFLSQQESKNSSLIEDTFVSLSQDSKKSVTSNSSQQFKLQAITPKNQTTSKMDNTSINQSNKQSIKPNQMFKLHPNIGNTKVITAENISLNQPQARQSVAEMFNLQTTVPKINETKEKQTEYNKQRMGQMFNSQAIVTKRNETSETQQQNPTEYYRQIPPMNKPFNLLANISKNTEINEGQKQTSLPNQMFNLQTITTQNTEINQIRKPTPPVEDISKTVNFLNPVSRPLETKSPYFVNQTITSSQEESVSLNTSAEQSDQVANISSDQPPSQISAVDISDEYFDTTTNQPMDVNQMINAEGAPIIDFGNAGYMGQYFGETPDDMASLGGNQYLSPPPFNSPPNYVSPNESVSGAKQQNNIAAPTTNNIFGAPQSTGNSFFSFGQSETKTGSIFNMFN